MNGAQTHAAAQQETHGRATAGGSLLEGFGAIATVALAIVGLAGIWSTTMAAIATIVAGATAWMEGGALWMRNSTAGLPAGAAAESAEGTTGADFIGGLAAVVLGILALLRVASLSLVPIAVLALGVGFLLGGRVFVGLGAAVLGILAICGIAPATLSLVGLLTVGTGLLLSGSQITARTLATQRNP